MQCKRTMFGLKCRIEGEHHTHEIQFASDGGRDIILTWREADAKRVEGIDADGTVPA